MNVRHDQLEPATLTQVIETLSPHMTPGRRRTIERVLGGRSRDVAVALENVNNAHNGAAVARSVEAMGFFELHLIQTFGRFRMSAKVASGAHRWLDLRRHDNLSRAYDSFRSDGRAIWASSLGPGAVPLEKLSFDRPVVLVFGNERSGLSEEAQSLADGRFYVRMGGFVESYNISVAVALACHEVRIRREARGLGLGLSPQDLLGVQASYFATSVQASAQILERAGLPRPCLPAFADVDSVLDLMETEDDVDVD